MPTIDAIPSTVLDLVRASGVDPHGTPSVTVVAGGGEQLRCCLRAATAGEEVLLFGYDPPIPTSPYATSTAVFAHATACDGPTGGYPGDWRSKPQVFRAYDERGWIHDATRVWDGDGDPEGVLDAMLADPGVAQVHVHNIGYGCFVLRATR